MADGDGGWTFDVQSVSRITADPDDDDGVVTYAVVFDVDGPDATAEIEVFVTDVPDPAQIIIMAMALLHRALSEWTRVTLGRRIANDDQA